MRAQLDRDVLRMTALEIAARKHPEGTPVSVVTADADGYFGWLVRHPTERLAVQVQVVHDGNVAFVGRYTVQGEEGIQPVMTAMQDIDTATVTIEPEDSMNQPTGDSLTVAQDDGGTPTTGGAPATPGSVANVTYDVAGGITTVTVAPVAEGTVTLTVADPSAPSVAAFVNSFNVSASETASLVGNVTVNTGANTPPAPSA